jgi:hypothetical protein
MKLSGAFGVRNLPARQKASPRNLVVQLRQSL